MAKSRDNNPMTSSLQNQFFALLRGGLWEDYIPSAELFTGQTDWAALYRVSRQQTVTALVWDGIAKLPVECQPQFKLRMEWLAMVMQIEKTNQLVDKRLTELFEAYRQNGIRPVLLKGQGLAANYLNPLHRQCGDIDIYVGKNNYKLADDIAKGLGITEYVESEKHSNFIYKGVHIENHRHIATIHNRSRLKEFNRITAEWFPDSNKSVFIDGIEIPVPPTDFNITYVFLHLFEHFISGGVGFRHICDWAKLIAENPGCKPDMFGYEKGWKAFGYIAVKYLGLSEEKMPYYTDMYHKEADKTLKLIFAEGNFGFSDLARVTERPKGYLSGKLFSFRRGMMRLFGLFSSYPRDTIDYIFGYWISLALKTIAKDKFNARMD